MNALIQRSTCIVSALMITGAVSIGQAEDPATAGSTTESELERASDLPGSSGSMPDDSASQYPGDNTGRNAIDQDKSALTAEDQSSDPNDLEITRKIRSEIVGKEALSTNAQNVKIITNGGVVTLRGPVANEEEKRELARMAEEIEGVDDVDNQLEVLNQ